MRLTFNRFALDLTSHTLHQDGNIIPIEPKLFTLLLYFCQHSHQAITREELLETVWDKRIVSFAAINRAVSELRKIIEDDPGDPQILITVSKVGYKFVADVEQVATNTADSATKVDLKIISNKAWLIFSSLFLLLIVTIFLSIRSEVTSSIDDQWQDVPLTVNKGISFKPTGNQESGDIAYLHKSKDGDSAHVWIKPLHGEAEQITNDDYYYTYALIADNNTIFASRFNDLFRRECEIVKIDKPSKQVTIIRACSRGSITYLAVDSGTNKLYFNHRKDVNRPYSIMSLQLDTGREQQVTFANSHGNLRGDYLFSLSADASKLAVVEYQSDGTGLVKLVDIENLVEPIQLSNFKNVSAVDWLDDKQLIVSESQGIMTLNIETNQMSFLTKQPNVSQAQVTKQGVVYVSSNTSQNIYNHPLNQPDDLIKAVTHSRHSNIMPSHANSSNKLVYLSNDTGKWQIYLKAESGIPRSLSFPNTIKHINNISWAKDDSFIVVSVNSQLYRYHFSTMKWQLIEANIRNFHYVDVMDSENLLVSSDHSGDWQIWQVNMQTGKSDLITQTGGYSAQLSENGQLVYYTKFVVPGLYKLSLVTGQEQLVLPEIEITDWNKWLIKQGELYFVKGKGIERRNLDVIENSDKWLSTNNIMPNNFSISADGQWASISQMEDSSAEIRLLTRTK